MMFAMNWQQSLLLLASALAALVVTAVWLERSEEKVDSSAASIEWGGERAGAAPPVGMVFIEGGEYVIGDDWPDPATDAPPRRVRIESFYIDRHETTNREFERFVAETGHVTSAERAGGAWVYRGGESDWTYIEGANWRHPLGPGSSIERASEHPVVLVSWHDAVAYAHWAGKRLPTEAEWEVAARGGQAATFREQGDARGPLAKNASLMMVEEREMHEARVEVARWKDEYGGEAPHPSAGARGAHADGRANPAEDGSANVWQGRWPSRNALIDGYFYTAPVGTFEPNGYGLYDMIGNVWEWTADVYDTHTVAGGDDEHERLSEADFEEARRVARGGSWFCSSNYCGAYRPGFRGKSPPASAFNNVGFRCARDAR